MSEEGMRQAILAALRVSQKMQYTERSSVTLAALQEALVNILEEEK